MMCLVAVSSENISVLLLQEIAGLAAFCLQFRRPLFACLSSIFFWISHPRSGPPAPDLIDELLVLASVTCSIVCDIRAGVDPHPICTDASESGGGSCSGYSLASPWAEFWLADYDHALKNPLHVGACGISELSLSSFHDVIVVLKGHCREYASIRVTLALFAAENTRLDAI